MSDEEVDQSMTGGEGDDIPNSGEAGDGRQGSRVSRSEDSQTSLKDRIRNRLPFGLLKNKSSATTTNTSEVCNNCRPENKRRTGRGWTFKLCARSDSSLSMDSMQSPAVHSYTSPCVCTAYRRTDDSVLEDEVGVEETCASASSSASSSLSSPTTRSDPTTHALQASGQACSALPAAGATTSQDHRPASPPIPGADQANHLLRERQPGVRMLQNSPADSRSGAPGHNVSAQVRVSELAIALRNQLASVSPYPYVARWGDGNTSGSQPLATVSEVLPSTLFSRFCSRAITENTLQPVNEVASSPAPQFHSQAEYIHRLVPDLMQISNCSFYWGKMDRYEAEKLLENRPEGTFLLRDSAQEEHLFSVSFRRFDRSLHARIEQWNNRFSFDSHDPGVFSSSTVCGLIEHYKDPSHCMFFEPMLTMPLHRNFPFSLQHLCRASLCSRLTYDSVNQLPIPKRIRSFLKEYHYRQQVRMRFVES